MSRRGPSAREDEDAQRWLAALRDGGPAEKLAARAGLAAIFERRGMLQEAIDLCEANLQAGADDPALVRRLARLYRRLGRTDLADEVLRPTPASRPTRPRARPPVAGEVQAADDDRVARQYLELLRNGSPREKAIARDRLGPIFERRGMLEEAAELYETNLRLGMGAPGLHDRLADVYHRLGRPDLAAEVRDSATAAPGNGAPAAAPSMRSSTAGPAATSGHPTADRQANRGCPICGSADSVMSVPDLFELRHAPAGRRSGISHHLARLLAPPPRPGQQRAPLSPLALAVIGLGLATVALAAVLTVLTGLSPLQIGEAVWALLGVVLAAILALALWQRPRTSGRIPPARLAAYRAAVLRWRNAYYCFDDDVIFVAGESGAYRPAQFARLIAR